MTTAEERIRQRAAAAAEAGKGARKRSDRATGAPTARARQMRASGEIRTVKVEAFDAREVRLWRYANRVSSGMSDEEMEELAGSMQRDGQIQVGLARRLEPGGRHKVECIFGRRRLAACGRAGTKWHARVVAAEYTDADCAKLMWAENEHSARVGPLEEAAQWVRMMEDGVFSNQSDLCRRLGVSKSRVSRMLRAAEILERPWLAELVAPVVGEITVAEGERIARALEDEELSAAAERAAADAEAGDVAAGRLYPMLFGRPEERRRRGTVVMARRGAKGCPGARVMRGKAGAFTASVDGREAEAGDQVRVFEALCEAWGAERPEGRRELFRARLAAVAEYGGAALGEEALAACAAVAARSAGLSLDRAGAEAAARVLASRGGSWEGLVAAVADTLA